jgi:hypothetical protein
MIGWRTKRDAGTLDDITSPNNGERNINMKIGRQGFLIGFNMILYLFQPLK